MSKIEWTDKTWNPITGCSWISPGCDNCYAKVMANRLHHNPKMKDKYRNNFKVTCHPEELKRNFPGKGKKIFVCSMSDLFHNEVPSYFIIDILRYAMRNQQHIFQLLTKRLYAANSFIHCRYFDKYPDNCWLGTTVENQKTLNERKGEIEIIPAKVRFLSIEPMLGPIVIDDYTLECIDWVIVGGETGPKAREMNPDWARSIRDQCQSAGVPFFFKQMSKKQPIPDDLNIKQFPK